MSWLVKFCVAGGVSLVVTLIGRYLPKWCLVIPMVPLFGVTGYGYFVKHSFSTVECLLTLVVGGVLIGKAWELGYRNRQKSEQQALEKMKAHDFVENQGTTNS